MFQPLAPITPVLPRSSGAENQQNPQARASREAANSGADAMAQSSARGTTETPRTAAVPAPEAAAWADSTPQARPGSRNLPVGADARSVMMAIASDRDPQIYGPAAEKAAAEAAENRARIMTRAQSFVEAVMAASDRPTKPANPYGRN